MKIFIDHLPITRHLDHIGYDYLNLPKGDGVHDDGPIIQARAFVSRNNSGVSVLLPHGNHLVATSIALPSNVRIVGVP